MVVKGRFSKAHNCNSDFFNTSTVSGNRTIKTYRIHVSVIFSFYEEGLVGTEHSTIRDSINHYETRH